MFRTPRQPSPRTAKPRADHTATREMRKCHLGNLRFCCVISGHLTEVTPSQESLPRACFCKQTKDTEESRIRDEGGCTGYPSALARHRRQLFAKNLQARHTPFAKSTQLRSGSIVWSK